MTNRVLAALLLASCSSPPAEQPPKLARLTTQVGKNSAEYGFADGTGESARLYWPEGLALDASRRHLYIADSANHAIRRYHLDDDRVETVAGVGGTPGFRDSSADDAGVVPALLDAPRELVLSPDGKSLWFTDTGNDVIRRLDLERLWVSTELGSPHAGGSADGVGAQARFGSGGLFNQWPGALLFDGPDTLYIADGAHHTLRVADVPTRRVTTLAGRADAPGHEDGTGPDAAFHKPAGLALDGKGGLLIAEANNLTLRRYDLKTGAVTTLAGKAPPSPSLFCENISPMQPRECGWVDAAGTDARFRFPFGVARDDARGLFIVDSHNSVVRRFDLDTTEVVTVAGAQHVVLEDSNHASTDTTETDPGTFWHPTHAVFEAPGVLYVSDRSANCVRRVELR